MRPRGAHKSPKDDRDYPFGQHPRAGAMLARGPNVRADNSHNLPAPWDQGMGETCEAHGVPAAALPFWPVEVMPARLDLYYRARVRAGLINLDAGVDTRSMLATMVEGCYDERRWAYDLDQVQTRPPDAERPFCIGSYEAITTPDHLAAYISAGGIAPFSIDLPLTFDEQQELDTPARGIIYDLTGSSGWHCQAGVGHDLNFRSSALFRASGLDPVKADDAWLKVRGSYGDKIALGGYLWLPFSIVFDQQRGRDCWAVHPAGNM